MPSITLSQVLALPNLYQSPFIGISTEVSRRKISILLPTSVLNINIVIFINTVKPLYNGHHRKRKKVSAIRRYLLYRGWNLFSKKLI